MQLVKEHRKCKDCGKEWIKTKILQLNGNFQWVSGPTYCPFCPPTRSYSSLTDLPKKKDWVDKYPQVVLETIQIPEFAIFVWDEKEVKNETVDCVCVGS